MITTRTIYFFIVLSIFLAGLLATGGYYYVIYRRRKKYPYGKWENILSRLTLVDRDSIALVALDFVDESGERRASDYDDMELDPSQIWPLVGGMKGLEVLERNCDVLVDLVFYVQQWYPEALTIAELLRSNTREIQYHVSRLRAAAKTGKLEASFPDYAQRVVATYYLMTRRVLTLYERANLPGLAELQKAL